MSSTDKVIEADVGIIGAGPAGTAAALHLGQLGVRNVVLIDREDFPRDKTCGSGLSPKGIETLKSGNVGTAAKGETVFPGVSSFTDNEVFIDVQEVRKAETNAQLVAENIATQLERRIAFRRAMKRAVQAAMRLGAEGIRINCGGRLGGAEIARSEWYREGRVPLHTLRGNVDYAEAQAHTAYGVCGVKVWVFKGEILGHDPLAQDRLMMEAQTSGVRPARDDRR